MASKNNLKKLILAADQSHKERNYWLTKFSGDLVKSHFPFESQVVHRQKKMHTRRINFQFTGELFARLMKVSNRSDVRVYIIMVTGLVIMLYKYTSTRDIIVGTPTYKQDVEGELINTVLALRNQVNPAASCKELLLQAAQNIFEANENQNYPIEALLYKLGMPLEGDGFPLFDAAVLLKNLHDPGYLHRVPINMIFSFLRTGETIEGELEYNGGLFNEASARRIAAHFKCILEEILFNIDTPVSSIRILTPGEKKQLLIDFNNNRAEFSTDKSVCHFIEDHAQLKLDKIALVYNRHQVTYHRLNEQANRLAGYLQKTGAARNQVVAILLNRSPLMVESILAAWKTGCAYLPIDPGYPGERINYMLADSGANMLVTTNSLAEEVKKLRRFEGKRILLEDITQFSSTLPPFHPSTLPSSSLAYIIYTSGSTGKPKGACVEHIGMMNHISAKINDLDLSGQSIIAQNATHTFDISVWQLFTALTLAGQTVIYPEECILVPGQFLSRLTRDRVTILEVVPSYLSVLLDFIRDQGTHALPPGLVYLVVTGEEIKPVLVKEWFETYTGIPMVNAYGPTEASDDITHYIMEKAPDRPSIPIGKSLQNMNIYIVDDDMQLCPIGVKGEICVSGTCVGRGYINNPELTRERFCLRRPGALFEKTAPGPHKNFSLSTKKVPGKNHIQSYNHAPMQSCCRETMQESPYHLPYYPITPLPHYPIYKTGDLGRWLSDGTIEFFGRKDYQVKIRGFRIELGEIENKLSGHPGIKHAVVIDREDDRGNKYLCAYVVEEVEASKPANVLRFQAYLKERLPEHMIPSYFVLLEEIPLTPNGKVDRKALPAPGLENSSPIKYMTIEMLEQMGRNKPGSRDLSGEITWEGLDNIAEISRNEDAVLETYSKEKGKNYYPLSHAQKMVYYVEKTYPGTSCENDGDIVLYTGEFHRELLEQAINSALERNESLRTRVKDIESGDFFGPAQYVVPYKTHSFDYLDFPGKEGKKDLEKWITLHLDKPFQFIDGNLYYFAIIKLDHQNGYYMKLHHITADGNSTALLIHEIDTIYQDLLKGSPVDRAANPSHIQYISDEKEYLFSPRSKSDRQYWLDNLLPLPREVVIGTKKGDAFNLSGNSVKLNFNDDLRSRLHAYRKNHKTSLYKLILSALSIYIFNATGLEDFVIGTLNHGRFLESHQRMPGMFINFIPARIKIDPGMEYRRFLQELGTYINDIIKNHSMYPADLLSNDLKKITGRDTRYFWNITLIGHPDREKKAFHMEHISSNYEATPLVVHINCSNKDIEGTLELEWVYQVEQFTPAEIKRIHHHLMTILTQALDHPGKKLSGFEFLSTGEKKQIPADPGDIGAALEIGENKIETDDIEKVLQAYHPVERAVAVVKKEKNQAPYLCVYVAASQGLTAKELHDYLLRHFPLEGVPVYFLQLEQIPVTPDGKMDHQFLEIIDINMYTRINRQSHGYEPPGSELEEKLVEIWQNVLGKDKIGVNDNFFTIGGDSIKTIQIASRMSKSGYQLEMKDIFRNPTIARLASVLEKKGKPETTPGEEHELNPGHLTYKGLSDEKLDQLTRTYHPLEIEDIYPLTPLQEGMLFHALYDRSSFAYFEQTSYRLEGNLNITLVEKSINQLFKRHDVLRTVFIHESLEQPLQVVFKERKVDFTYQDMRGLSTDKEEGKKACTREFREKDKQRRFDLGHDVLMRVSILHLDESEYEFTWSSHHILMDGWCIGIVISEFFEIYNSFLDNRPYQLPAVKPYRTYIQWLEQQDKQFSGAYWKKYLEGYEEAAPISQMSVQSKTGAGYKNEQAALELKMEKTAGLNRLAAANQVTLNTVVQTLWAIILGKYNCKEDVVFGVVVSGRPSTLNGIETMVGLFINTIPVRITFKGSMTFRQVLARVQENALQGERHHYYPLGHIQGAHVLKQDLLDHIFEFDNYPVNVQVEGFREVGQEADTRSSFRLSDVDFFAQTNYDFNIIVVPSRQLSIRFQYNANRFAGDFFQRMIHHLTRVVDQVLENQDQEIARITLLSPEAKKQLIDEFNQTYRYYPRDKTIHQLFEEQVEKTADGIVVVEVDKQFTYKQINEKANHLARILRAKKVGRDTTAAIMLERSAAMIIGILGILKAGAAYCSIDNESPQQRIVSMLNDCSTPILLSNNDSIKNLSFTALQDLQSGKVKCNRSSPRPQILDLDNMPVTDRSTVDNEKYNQYLGESMVKNCISIQATRGCPYNCTYCHKIWPKHHVIRSAENIFNELLIYYNMGIRRFALIDDIFNLNIKNSTGFFKLIIEKGLDVNIFFPNGLRGDLLTKKYIDLMVQAGTTSIALALESASPRLQKMMRKNLDIERLHENAEYICEKYPHIILELYLMHGFPTETREEAKTTLDFLKSLKWVHFPHLNILKIFPNTEMAELAFQNGVSSEDILKSENLAFHELPFTLPFDKKFSEMYKVDYLNNYFLLKERLLGVLPHQMRILTEDEMVMRYNSFFPDEITSFNHLLQYLGISKDELPADGCLDPKSIAVHYLNKKMKTQFPAKEAQPNALKILLLDLSQAFSHEAHQLNDMVEPPLGLMCLLTYINRQYGSKINGRIAKALIDFDNYPELRELLDFFKPDVIGIRTLSFYKDFFHRTVAKIREWGFSVPIISGGPYATSNPEIILQDRNLDVVVMGEGEITFSQLVGEIIENRGKLPADDVLDKIAGIAYMTRKEKSSHQLGREIIFLDQLTGFPSINPGQYTNITHINSSTDLAYNIFTSGSTGNPKGVMIKHRNVVRLVKNSAFIKLGQDTRLIQTGPLEFDASTIEIWGPLLNGGVLYQVHRQEILMARTLKEKIQTHAINTMWMTSPLFNQMVDTDTRIFETLETLIVGGDILSPPHINRIREQFPQLAVVNGYGPTENTTFSTTFPIDGEYNKNIPIGKPISNSSAFIVDAHLDIQPIGVVGELVVGGDGLARGYMNDPELTFEKFKRAVISHWSFVIGSPKERSKAANDPLYRTGDLARWLPDGNIEFLGRIDLQVKIRGFRIELGEIESQLKKIEGIKQAVVLVRERKSGEKYICAYFVTEKHPDPMEIRNTLGIHLPDHMLPSNFIPVEQIPLTSNGKVDKRVLLTCKFTDDADHLGPTTETEEIITNAWKEVLELDKVGIDKNFFEVGGTSLDVIRVTNRMKENLKRDIPVVILFQYPTISTLAGYLDGEEESGFVGDERGKAVDKGKETIRKRLQKKRGKKWEQQLV